MTTKRIGNPSPKSSSLAKSTAPTGLSTMNTQGAPLRLGVNPNKGMPADGNMSGLKGGSPGIKPANGGGTQKLRNVHMGQPGSGHDSKAASRASSTGYGLGGAGKKGR